MFLYIIFMKQPVFKLFSLVILCIACNSAIVQSNVFASVSSVQDIHIVKIDSLSQINDSQPAQTLYFFDIDDTLFDSPHMLGSKAWRKYIVEATRNNLTENWHDIFSLFLARSYPLETVEALTSQFVKELQRTGRNVVGLTARERMRWYDMPVDDVDFLTVSQLESVGINFNNKPLDKAYAYLTNNPEYYKGVFFADIEPKGEYLLKLFRDAPQLPEKVIFIDDKQSQVESVAAALNQLGVNYECYWYSATDSKARKFDPWIANIQLYYFWISDGKRVISDEEAAAIADRYPERNAEYYLRSLLIEAKAKTIKE